MEAYATQCRMAVRELAGAFGCTLEMRFLPPAELRRQAALVVLRLLFLSMARARNTLELVPPRPGQGAWAWAKMRFASARANKNFFELTTGALFESVLCEEVGHDFGIDVAVRNVLVLLAVEPASAPTLKLMPLRLVPPEVFLDVAEELFVASGGMPTQQAQVLAEHCLRPLTAGASSATLEGLRVVDPACGYGRRLLAAARHLATALEHSGRFTADSARLHVAEHCIYGVDRDALAVGIARAALTLFVGGAYTADGAGRHVVTGNSLVGVVRPEEVHPHLAAKMRSGFSYAAAKLLCLMHLLPSAPAVDDRTVQLVLSSSSVANAREYAQLLHSRPSNQRDVLEGACHWFAHFPKLFLERGGFDAVLCALPWRYADKDRAFEFGQWDVLRRDPTVPGHSLQHAFATRCVDLLAPSGHAGLFMRRDFFSFPATGSFASSFLRDVSTVRHMHVYLDPTNARCVAVHTVKGRADRPTCIKFCDCETHQTAEVAHDRWPHVLEAALGEAPGRSVAMAMAMQPTTLFALATVAKGEVESGATRLACSSAVLALGLDTVRVVTTAHIGHLAIRTREQEIWAETPARPPPAHRIAVCHDASAHLPLRAAVVHGVLAYHRVIVVQPRTPKLLHVLACLLNSRAVAWWLRAQKETAGADAVVTLLRALPVPNLATQLDHEQDIMGWQAEPSWHAYETRLFGDETLSPWADATAHAQWPVTFLAHLGEFIATNKASFPDARLSMILATADAVVAQMYSIGHPDWHRLANFAL